MKLYKTIGEVAEIVNLINPKNGSLSTLLILDFGERI